MDLLTPLALVIALASIIVAILVVLVEDLVYASSLLAILGSLTAAMVAVAGYYLVAAFIVIVYVGAAVMFIVLSISMLGGRGPEVRNNIVGVAVALVTLAILSTALITLGVPSLELPVSVNARVISDNLTTGYLSVLLVLIVALAATVLEGIAVARRG